MTILRAAPVNRRVASSSLAWGAVHLLELRRYEQTSLGQNKGHGSSVVGSCGILDSWQLAGKRAIHLSGRA